MPQVNGRFVPDMKSPRTKDNEEPAAERACDLATVDADKLKADIQGFEEKLGNLSEDDARRAYLYNEIAWCKLKLAQ